MHCLSCHLQIGHHWTILVRGRQRVVCDNQHRAISLGAWQVLDSTWSTERGRQGPLVVPARWCHPPLLKRIIGMATAAFPWPTDQPQVWPAVVAAFTGLEPPDYHRPEGSSKSDPKGGMREGHRELCPPDPNVSAAPGSSFGAHFWAPVKQRVFVVQTWNFGDVCNTGLT